MKDDQVTKDLALIARNAIAYINKLEQQINELKRAAPPQRKPLTDEERNFCPRCGKRTRDIHTCTPPQAEPEGDALTAAYMLGRHDGKRKPLSDLAISEIYLEWDKTPGVSMADFARAIERVIWEKNND